MNHYINITFVLLVIIGCNNIKKNKSLIVKFDRKITLNKSSLTNDFYNFQYIENYKGNEVIICNAQYNNNLFIFDLSGNLKNTITIDCKTSFSDYYFENDTSLFFIPKYSSNIYKWSETNNNCEKLFYKGSFEDFIPYMDTFDIGNLIEFTSYKTARFQKKGSAFFIPNSLSFLENDYLTSSHRPLLKIVLSDSSFEINSKIGRFPNHLTKKKECIFPFDFNISYTINNKQEIICSYSVDTRLYIYNPDGTLNKTIDNENSHFTNKDPFIKRTELNNTAELFNKLNYQSYYYGIYYDKYRDLYFRLLKHEKEKPSKTALIDNDNFNYSIIVLNKNFEEIEEITFNNLDYQMYDFLICKEGFLMRSHSSVKNEVKLNLFQINI